MGDSLKVCSMPEMTGQTAVKKEYVSDLKKTDLNFDGKDDEYVLIHKNVIKICGEMSQEAVVKSIVQNYGAYEKMVKGDNLLVGRNWRATYKVENGVTTIIGKIAIPIFTESEGAKFKIKHLDRSVRLGDPIKVKDGEGRVFFVLNFDLSNAIAWDGKELTVDYNSVKVNAISKEGIEAIRKGEEPEKEDMKTVSLAKISKVMPRDDFPDMYAQK